MDEMIDFLRDKTIFARHSRAETRDFLERLEIEGYEIAPKVMPPLLAVKSVPLVEV
jgi:hypothetical protein